VRNVSLRFVLSVPDSILFHPSCAVDEPLLVDLVNAGATDVPVLYGGSRWQPAFQEDKHDAYLSATSFASMGWLLPVRSLILLDAMAVAWLLAA